MKIALVDDEQTDLDKITQICQEFGEENCLEIEISTYMDGESFLQSSEQYTIVFMDIYMRGINGVLAAKKFRRYDCGCILIFLTSSTGHMPEAFSCHAFEYIVKPFSTQRVKDVLNDAMKIITVPSKYIDLYSDKRTVRIALDDIVSAVTDAHYLDIKLVDGTSLRCRMTMGQFMELVNGDFTNNLEHAGHLSPWFLLVNKGITLNADYIIKFETNCCILENGTQFPIRVRDRLKIEQAVQNYNFDKIRSHQRYGKQSNRAVSSKTTQDVTQQMANGRHYVFN